MGIIDNNRGTIALISILIISAITIILVVAMSEVNVSTSYQYLNTSSNKIAYYAAEACLEEAIVRTEGDINFSVGSLTIDSDTACTISASGTTTKNVIINVTHLSYEQTFQAQLSASQAGESINAELVSWSEI